MLRSLAELPPLPKPSRKLPNAPELPHVERMLVEADGWAKSAIGLSVYAGLRMGEARALEVRDVDIKRGHILVRHALSADEVLPPKSGHERVVSDWRRSFGSCLKPRAAKLPHARVSCERREERATSAVSSALVRGREAVLAWASFGLFPFAAPLLSASGGTIRGWRECRGCALVSSLVISKLDVTQRYVHATADDLRAAIARLPGN